ncbi:hypothetical protein FW778_02085 [Ginsengibacter hankyongi]|uniref:B12-binding domain-containing protein n=1 Tax=Ginsengibacter hankyongi TaxID=2607284 RepID=A0A5J5IKE3_9BACT|nr:cobalamin-dependent protein [Ginsengibacter hankyongi]KAA9040853.1 hypothetical protein FW778_02085 [Ginsengibacter hankyongi]
MEMHSASTTGLQIKVLKLPLAELITTLHFQHQPELEIKNSKAGREECKKESLFHLTYLAEAIASGSNEIFNQYLQWAAVMRKSRNIPMEDLITDLDYIDFACEQLLPAHDYRRVKSFITAGSQYLKDEKPLPLTTFSENNPLLAYAKQYQSFLLNGNRLGAQALIDDLISNGEAVTSIYEHIFQATQHEIGFLWQTNKISVAHEHYCTAATQQIIATLYTRIFTTAKKGVKMLACAVSGDLHEMGIRMISDFFELDGWDTFYLGANMPDSDIIAAIKEQKVDLLALSVTMPFHISKAERLIRKIRSDDDLSQLKIIVGGYSFSQAKGLWKDIGADGSAQSAKEAVQMGNQMITLQ